MLTSVKLLKEVKITINLTDGPLGHQRSLMMILRHGKDQSNIHILFSCFRDTMFVHDHLLKWESVLNLKPT